MKTIITNKQTKRKFSIILFGFLHILIVSCQNEIKDSNVEHEDIINSEEIEKTILEEEVESPTIVEIESIDTAAIIANAEELSEDELRVFIMKQDCYDCYGWNTNFINTAIKRWPMSYGFMTEGRLHAEGDEGEASMTEGTWELNGDQLHIVFSLWHYQDTEPVDVDITMTAQKSGEYLLLDEKLYWN